MLFRKEAVEAQKVKLVGDVFIVQPTKFKTIFLFIFVSIVCFILFVLFGSYTKTERVAGKIISSGGQYDIYSRSEGHISGVYVQQGDSVSKGQRIATIFRDELSEMGKPRRDEITNQLRNKIQLIEYQIENAASKHQSTLKLTEKKELEAINTSQFLSEQLSLQKRLTNKSLKNLERIKSMAESGHLSKTETDAAQENWLISQSKSNQLEHDIAVNNSLINRVAIEKQTLKEEFNELSLTLQKEIVDLQISLAEIEKNIAYHVVSPIDGVVSATNQLKIGSSVAPRQFVASVIPENNSLHAEIYLPSKAAGLVTEGQKVKVLYDAFPYQRYGFHSASIKSITKSAILSNDIDVVSNANIPVFKATILLSDAKDTDTKLLERIQPGMTLQAIVEIDRQTFLDWMLNPIRSSFESF